MMTLRIEAAVLYTQLDVKIAFSKTPRIYTIMIFDSLNPKDENQSAIRVQSAKSPADITISLQDRRGIAENLTLRM